MSKRKTETATAATQPDEMLPEYDFSNMKDGTRGKYHKAYREGHTVEIHKADGTVSVQYFQLEDGAVMLEPDVQKYFPDSEAVNRALRALIAVAPKGRKQIVNQRVAGTRA
jgi:hypothetical protein